MEKTARWLPILAVALIAEAIALFLIPGDEEVPCRALAVIAAMLGLVTLLRALKAEANPESWAAAGFAAFGLFAIMAVGSYLFLRPFFGVNVRAPLMYFSVPAYVLMGAGGTVLWAAALARREQPDHPRLAQIGRIGAGIAQLGFFFAFINEIPSFGRAFDPGVPAYALNSLVRLVVRILLLWGSVQMMRTSADPDVLRGRLTRVHHLMIAWAVMMAVNSLVMFGTWNGQSLQSPVPNFLRNIVYVTAIGVAAFTFARRIRHLPKEPALSA